MKAKNAKNAAGRLSKRYKYAVSVVKQVVIPEKDSGEALKLLQDVIDENDSFLEKKYQEYLGFDSRTPELDEKVETNRNALLNIIQECLDNIEKNI